MPHQIKSTYYPEANQITQLSRAFIRDEKMYYSVWQAQTGNSYLIQGELYKIVFPGYLNRYSGPDFKNAILLSAGGEFISGDVEIHTSVRQWERHGHKNDLNYAKVILHVVINGKSEPVLQTDLHIIPTIKLAGPGKMVVDPCSSIVSIVGKESILPMIKTYAKIRWDELLNNYSRCSGNQVIQKVFHSVVFHTNSKLKDILFNRFIKYNCQGVDGLYQVIEMISGLAESMIWDMGGKRPASHPLNRIAIAVWLAHTIQYKPMVLEAMEFKDLIQAKEKLVTAGFRVPGISYLQELFANFIVPISVILSPDMPNQEDLFEKWYCLPVQPYSLVIRRLNTWGLKSYPLSFGLQQGIIYLEKSMCAAHLCHHCSMMSWNETNCFTT